MYNVQNKVAIITGASSGFGTAMAWKLTSKGAKVILGDIDIKAGERLATEINYNRTDKIAYFVRCDVTKTADLEALFTAADKHFGGTDIVLNNAGIAENVPLWADDKDLWRKVLDIDLTAVVDGTRLGMKALEKRGGGVIINTASLAGLYPQLNTPTYSAAKFGVVGLTRSLKPLKDTVNIRVNAVAPSYAPTKIIAPLVEAFGKENLTGLVSVEQVVEAFMLLIEDESLAGDIARVTAKYGVTVIGKTPENKKSSKL